MDIDFKINSFQSGLNRSTENGLVKPYEAVALKNLNIDNGSLKTVNSPLTTKAYSSDVNSVTTFYGDTEETLVGVGIRLVKISGTDLYGISGLPLDFVNFVQDGKKVLIGNSRLDYPFVYNGTTVTKLKNRRKKYDDKGVLVGYIDNNGVEHTTEDTIQTYAPSGDFMELHFDRLWVSGNIEFKDRVYFSTANRNGADIQDFTVPLAEEEEINQHGGFLDINSYDGGKIIAMKVVFNTIVIFKTNSAYKLYGDNPNNYQLVQMFSCNGAIGDKTIVVADNGAYFLNKDGLYFFDGTNTQLISYRIQEVFKEMNMNYADKSVATFHNGNYYIAIPTGNSTVNNTLIQYNTLTKAFSIFDLNKQVNGLYTIQNNLFFFGGKEIGKVFGDTATQLNGEWITPTLDFGSKNVKKTSTYLYFRGYGESVTIEVQTERNLKEITIPLTAEDKLYRVKLKAKGRTFRFRFYNKDGKKFTLIAPQITLEGDMD